jgi:uncharacterized protein (TIGR00369 family)
MTGKAAAGHGVALPEDLSPEEKARFEEIARRRTRFSPYYDLLGLRLVELGRGSSRFHLPVKESLLNAGGVVHGGALASLADAAMGVALATLLDPAGERPVTVEMKINFARPVTDGELEAHGRIVQRGRTLALGEARVTDGQGRLAALALGTFAVRPIAGRETGGSGDADTVA